MADEGFENHFIGRIVGRKVVETDWVEFPDGHFETYLAEEWDRRGPDTVVHGDGHASVLLGRRGGAHAIHQDQTALLDECKRVGVHSIIVAPFPNPKAAATSSA